MPFWMLVLIMVTLITLCWGGGYGFYRASPDRPFVGGILGVLGLILFIVLVMIFVGGAGTPITYPK